MEYWIGSSAVEQARNSILARHFETPGLDLASAILAAELLGKDMAADIRAEFGIGKQCVKTDAQIIAIAICNHAIKIITDNVLEFRRLSRGKIQVDPVPDVLAEQAAAFSGRSEEAKPPESGSATQQSLFDSDKGTETS